MQGMGAAPEAIETDPIDYDLLFESTWRAAPISDVKEWVRGWAVRRYSSRGQPTPPLALEAWARAVDGPYGVTRVQQGAVGSLLAARPAADAHMKVDCCDGHEARDIGYDPAIVLSAWEMLLESTAPIDNASAADSASATAPTHGASAAASDADSASAAAAQHDECLTGCL